MPDPPVVLVVEDEPGVAELYTEQLANDYEVRTTIDAGTASELFA